MGDTTRSGGAGSGNGGRVGRRAGGRAARGMGFSVLRWRPRLDAGRASWNLESATDPKRLRGQNAGCSSPSHHDPHHMCHGNGSVHAGIFLRSGCRSIASREVIRSDVKDGRFRRALRIDCRSRQERHGANIIEQTRRDLLAISFIGLGSRLLMVNTCDRAPTVNDVNIRKKVALRVVHGQSSGCLHPSSERRLKIANGTTQFSGRLKK